MRSRDSEKNFSDWGTGTITTDDRMKPIVYDEITSLAHAEFRFAKEFIILIIAHDLAIRLCLVFFVICNLLTTFRLHVF